MIQNQCLHLKFVDFQKCNIDARLLHIFAIIDGYNDKGYKPGWHMTWVRFEKKNNSQKCRTQNIAINFRLIDVYI